MAIIGIDIDDTITDTTSTLKEYIKLHDKEYSNDGVLLKRIDTIIRGFFDHDAIKAFFKDYSLEMGKKYEVRKDASKYINMLKEEGHTIYIISARSNTYFIDAEQFCKDYLDSKGIPFDKIFTSQLYKIQTCKKENVDIMVDDAVDTCDMLNQEGVNALLFSTEINEEKQATSKRVKSWEEAYYSIHELLDQKRDN